MATDTTSAADAGQAAAGPGMPQLDFSTLGQPDFLVGYHPDRDLLSSCPALRLPRIASVLAERQGTITNDLAAAEDLKSKAHEAEAAYEKALIDARAEAQRIVAETKAGYSGRPECGHRNC